MPPLSNGVKAEFLSHNELYGSWSFIATENGVILGIKHLVTKVYSLCDVSNGLQRVNPQGEKEFYIEGQVLVREFSREEYRKIAFSIDLEKGK